MPLRQRVHLGMLGGGALAAPDVAARRAAAQMQPPATGRVAVDAARTARRSRHIDSTRARTSILGVHQSIVRPNRPAGMGPPTLPPSMRGGSLGEPIWEGSAVTDLQIQTTCRSPRRSSAGRRLARERRETLGSVQLEAAILRRAVTDRRPQSAPTERARVAPTAPALMHGSSAPEAIRLDAERAVQRSVCGPVAVWERPRPSAHSR